MLSPFLPFSANEVDRALGGKGEIAPMPRIDEVEDLDGARPTRSSPATTPATPAWARQPITVGAPVAKPTPIFTKLDPAIVDEELARLEA